MEPRPPLDGQRAAQGLKMPDLAKLPHELDEKQATCLAIVETPKGGRAKYNFDPKARAFRLKTLLPEGMSFPMDFGFIPSTLADDGDPLDVMILSDEPAPTGALMAVRLLGVLEAEEREKGKTERNDRLLGVASPSHLYAQVRTVEDLGQTFVDHLGEFWINKDKLEGKAFRLLGVGDGKAAVALIQKAAKRARRKG